MLLRQGLDLLELPFDRALNVAYSMIMPHDPTERFKMESKLYRPIPGMMQDTADPADDFWSTAKEDGQAFLSAMGQQSKMLGGT